MPRLDPPTGNIVIGRLQAGQSQNEVGRTPNINQSTISRLWNIFQQTGSSKEWKTSESDSWARSLHPGLSATESNRFRINHCSRNTWIVKNQLANRPQQASTAWH